ncbi:phosphoribosylamine--glycine ligase [Caldanaerobius fijiensis DSM 17918]|uniref:Phosphoribosylamine--glycine ligase n=1 Tax=Caldanaerobius fijiensis DSM 17918 TaxID=1121256 RepID=A0A1M5A717_9THEO|nr:phosphoribosylamine--glycine ligase [Caldanaerobius fijiensis]SHF26103.1 phosphoribosylamine--glycine ligase [Caldanaerobius fijiensis DSM 17918]
MKVLVVGGGGREHAIAWKVAQSPRVDKIYCAPGNAGIARIAQCVDIPADAVDELADFAQENAVDLTVVGPEVPLMKGIVDVFVKRGLRIFGPSRDAAVIEGSKYFAKLLLQKYNIPTARFKAFDNYEEAVKYLDDIQYPTVIKTDGLAQGKGVIIADDREEAQKALEDIMLKRIFGKSGDTVIIEEFLEGREASVLAFTDGKTVIPMVSAMDYKRIYDGDMGPNTGGMGNIAPNPYYSDEINTDVMEKILKPVIKALDMEGRKYKGVLYAGLMLTEDGPKVLEFNARFGDPETQVILPLLDTDIVDIMDAVIEERLNSIQVKWLDKTAICVVAASGGYPGKYQTGFEISGLDEVDDDVMVFHAGTKADGDKVLTAGGRVLAVTAIGDTLLEARAKAYDNIDRIDFKGIQYRRDIGKVKV